MFQRLLDLLLNLLFGKKKEGEATIGSLGVGRSKPVYRRRNGGLYLKLNGDFHMPTRHNTNKNSWVGDGMAEPLDPDEIVEVIQLAVIEVEEAVEQEVATIATIGSLKTERSKPVYRRANGYLYLKLSGEFHIRTRLNPQNQMWVGDGVPEFFDSGEIVEVIQPAIEPVHTS